MPFTASQAGLTGSIWKPLQVKPMLPAVSYTGLVSRTALLGPPAPNLALSKQGAKQVSKETFADYYLLKLLEFLKLVKGHLQKQVSQQIWGTARSSWLQLGRCFPDIQMAPDASSSSSLHLDGWKFDPDLTHSDGLNFYKWELVLPCQSKSQQNWYDKICLKILYSTSFFYQSLSRNCGPQCLWPSKIQHLRKVSVKARKEIPTAEQCPFLHFTVATEDALKLL